MLPACWGWEGELPLPARRAASLTGHAAAAAASLPPALLQFEDPQGHVVFERAGISETAFQFTSTTEGEYKLCFTAPDYTTSQSTRISVQWRMGAEATDWESVSC